LIFGLVLGGWNVLEGYFFTELPSENIVESIAYQFFVPALSEELVFRGLFLAILVHYLGKEWKTNNLSFGFISLEFSNLTVNFQPALLENINFDISCESLIEIYLVISQTFNEINPKLRLIGFLLVGE
jgi:hypothetical protein